MGGEVCRLYTNTTPFYTRDLSTLSFWYPRGIPKDGCTPATLGSYQLLLV